VVHLTGDLPDDEWFEQFRAWAGIWEEDLPPMTPAAREQAMAAYTDRKDRANES
jgi:hypothetical protein